MNVPVNGLHVTCYMYVNACVNTSVNTCEHIWRNFVNVIDMFIENKITENGFNAKIFVLFLSFTSLNQQKVSASCDTPDFLSGHHKIGCREKSSRWCGGVASPGLYEHASAAACRRSECQQSITKG